MSFIKRKAKIKSNGSHLRMTRLDAAITIAFTAAVAVRGKLWQPLPGPIAGPTPATGRFTSTTGTSSILSSVKSK